MPKGSRVTFLYNHYPLDHPNSYRAVCEETGAEFFDSGGDLGLHGSLNNWMGEADLPDDELLCVFDPDSDPDPGFEIEAERLMRKYPIGWCSLRLPAIEFWKDSWVVQDGAIYLPAPAHMHTSTFLVEALRKVGGFSEPREYYGGMEAVMDFQFKDAGYAVAWLENHYEHFLDTPEHLTDPEYCLWRRVYSAGYPGSFAEYLTEVASRPCPACGAYEMRGDMTCAACLTTFGSRENQ